ncbi:MAG: peptidoglycan editing factor PgeF, partial [Pseudomonadota bacterium]
RARCARHLGVTENQLATPYQIHSPDALIIDTPFADSERPKADAFVTKQAGLALGIATADCGPVLFADEDAGVIGAAHAGWRGATAGILSNTINAMVSLGAVPSKITAVLGPTIRQKSYEVGPEFVDNLTALSPANTTYLVPSKQDGHAMFDLPRFIVDHLKALNIGTVAELGLDTYEDEKRFFSYRRTTHRSEGDYGRLLSAIVLTP